MSGQGSGWTLIELLIGLSLAGVLATGGAGALRAGVRAWRTAAQMATAEPWLLMHDLRRELRNSRVWPDGLFVGEAQRLSFVTVVETGGASPGDRALARLTYALMPDAAGGDPALVRTEEWLRADGGAPVTTVLAHAVRRFDLAYAYRNETADPPWAWRQAWQEPSVSPRLVRLLLVIGSSARPSSASTLTEVVLIPQGRLGSVAP